MQYEIIDEAGDVAGVIESDSEELALAELGGPKGFGDRPISLRAI